MDRFYRQSGFLGNVLVLWYDHEATMRFAAGEHVDAECDAEIAEGALETYLCARHDGFREHPELKNGFEVRCENRREADHMTRVMAQITQETIPYRITWLDSTVRQRENVLA